MVSGPRTGHLYGNICQQRAAYTSVLQQRKALCLVPCISGQKASACCWAGTSLLDDEACGPCGARGDRQMALEWAPMFVRLRGAVCLGFRWWQWWWRWANFRSSFEDIDLAHDGLNGFLLYASYTTFDLSTLLYTVAHHNLYRACRRRMLRCDRPSRR